MNRFNRDTVYTLYTLKTNLCTEILHNLNKTKRIWVFLAVVGRVLGFEGDGKLSSNLGYHRKHPIGL